MPKKLMPAAYLVKTGGRVLAELDGRFLAELAEEEVLAECAGKAELAKREKDVLAKGAKVAKSAEPILCLGEKNLAEDAKEAELAEEAVLAECVCEIICRLTAN